MNASPSSHPAARPVMSVLGPVIHTELGVTDAHNHIWIDPVAGAVPDSPLLNQYSAILDELESYRRAGGSAILDCQPGGFGRNSNHLASLAHTSGVTIMACTGFHRKRYISPHSWLWTSSVHNLTQFFIGELEQGTSESLKEIQPVQAGFIKVALEATWQDTPLRPLEAIANAAAVTGAMIEVHTEKGVLAEDILDYFTCEGVATRQIVLCHMDKRPDIGLHTSLAQAGLLLEYDTFYHPKYNPEENLWPLIDKMCAAGLAGSIALATDMADKNLYTSLGNGPGLASLPGTIQNRLRQSGLPEAAIRQMLGENIARRLAGLA